jgi:hypothetical protein
MPGGAVRARYFHRPLIGKPLLAHVRVEPARLAADSSSSGALRRQTAKGERHFMY